MNESSAKQKTLANGSLSSSAAPSYAQAMGRTVKISEAKANLSKLAKEVAAGEEVFVSRSGTTVMKLVPLSEDEIAAAQSRKLPRDLWVTAKYFDDFDWNEWDRLDEQVHKIWRKFGHLE
jgi:prevent-host-death family protein